MLYNKLPDTMTYNYYKIQSYNINKKRVGITHKPTIYQSTDPLQISHDHTIFSIED